MTPLAAQTALWLVLGLTTGLLFAIAMFAVFIVSFAAFDGDTDDIADVEHFIKLTEEARSMVPAGLPLFDREKAAATTAALVRFQAKKDAARHALWASRDGRRFDTAASTATTRDAGHREHRAA
jgi:hypothetical protein